MTKTQRFVLLLLLLLVVGVFLVSLVFVGHTEEAITVAQAIGVVLAGFGFLYFLARYG